MKTDHRRQYRIMVFAHGLNLPGKKRPVDYAFSGWNPENAHEPGRLPASGSHTWVGIFTVRAAAMNFLALPHVFQVQVRTNQDRKVYLWNKDSSGRISGYTPDND